MSKSRIMGAGSSGYNYGVNKNSPGNGNGKWQGLWPSVGHARNARLINTRAGGDNRDVVFCINQLGGVGKISNMFATTADGVKDCGCILSSHLKEALHKLGDYALAQNKQLCLIGETETISQDIGLKDQFYTTFPTNLEHYVKRINDLKLEFAVTGPKDIQPHIVAMVTPPDAKLLKANGFGFPVKALCNNIIAYGQKQCGNSLVTLENAIFYYDTDKEKPLPNSENKSYLALIFSNNAGASQGDLETIQIQGMYRVGEKKACSTCGFFTLVQKCPASTPAVINNPPIRGVKIYKDVTLVDSNYLLGDDEALPTESIAVYPPPPYSNTTEHLAGKKCPADEGCPDYFITNPGNIIKFSINLPSGSGEKFAISIPLWVSADGCEFAHQQLAAADNPAGRYLLAFRPDEHVDVEKLINKNQIIEQIGCDYYNLPPTDKISKTITIQKFSST